MNETDETFLLARIDTLEAELAKRAKPSWPKIPPAIRKVTVFSALTTVMAGVVDATILLTGAHVQHHVAVSVTWAFFNALGWAIALGETSDL